MEVAMYQLIGENLREKRRTLDNWFSNAPLEEHHKRLGTADERQFADHLHVIDGVIAKTGDGTFGLCDVCHLFISVQHLEMDYTARVCSDHFTEPEVRQLEHELELAQSVQRALLPSKIPYIAGLELAAFTRPAQIVGGDIFDFIQYSDGSFGLVVADVAGHVISAGLVMASLQTCLRTLAPFSRNPDELISRLLHIYQNNINLTLFITMLIGCFDLSAQRFSYISAVHNPPLLVNATGEPVWLHPTGPAIGLVEGTHYRPEGCSLCAGDLLLSYTDGVTETMNPVRQLFGEIRLAETVTGMRHLPTAQIVIGLRQSIETFSEGQPLSDDTTIIAYKVI